MRKRLCCLAVLLFMGLSFAPRAAAEDALSTGREFTESFLAGAVDELWEVFTPDLQAVFGTAEGLRQFQGQVVSSFGSEPEIVFEELTDHEGWLVYQNILRFEGAEVDALIQWAFTEQGAIGGLYVTAVPREAPSEYLDYQTKTDLRLPFTGEWYVLWGGRTITENYHALDSAQRFALDFWVVKAGSTHGAEGLANEDYHAFGLPILAPGDGVVIAAVDGIPDNIPGVRNTQQPLGNYVIIDHQNGEYSFLAHLKEGSVAAKEGEWVQQGQLVGLCGNSGNSSEPHLHYHLQNSPDLGTGQGLPAQFRFYLADGKVVELGEPKRGEVVAPVE